MTRNEKYDRRRRREAAGFPAGLSPTLFDGPGLAVKLPFAALYPLGAVGVEPTGTSRCAGAGGAT